MHKGNFENKEEIILRDYLALERTKLANERTLLSYIRSSLYLLVGSVTAYTITRLGDLSLVAFLCLILALTLFIFGIIRFKILNKKLQKYYLKQ